MTIDVFVRTGEIRKVSNGDWHLTAGVWIQWKEDNISEYSYPIGIRHQIEVPEGLVQVHLYGTPYQSYPNGVLFAEFPLLRPKVKVKKWHWVVMGNLSPFFTSQCTEEEVKSTYPNKDWYHKIDETMIEVEE